MIVESVSGVKLRCEGRACPWLGWWSGHSIVNRGPERLLTLVHSLVVITNITQASEFSEKIESDISLPELLPILVLAWN